MKSLLVMRHAKSSWDDEAVSDHDRPLNARGRRDAPRMARRLAEAGLLPDRILCSTARRARETADLIVAEIDYAGPVEHDARLYHADADDILAVVAELPAAAGRILLIGHNPGLEELLHRLVGYGDHLPTAAVAEVELPIDVWSDVSASGPGRLVEFRRPKDEAE